MPTVVFSSTDSVVSFQNQYVVLCVVKTVAEAYQRSRNVVSAAASAGPESKTRPIVAGETVVSILATETSGSRSRTTNDLGLGSESVFLCHYCSKQCNSERQWDEHCASQEHMFNVNSDRDHQWNYRQPPWGVGGGTYKLCEQ